MVTLMQIKEALESLDYDGGDVFLKDYLGAAIASLETLGDALETVNVKGRENIDSLLGCMIGLEMIIGKKEEVDEDG